MHFYGTMLMGGPATELDGVFSRYRLSEDLELWAQGLVLLLVLATAVLLFFETRAHKAYTGALFATGLVGTLLLAFAVLRPTELRTKGHQVPGLSVALVDGSHRLGLPADDRARSRRAEAESAFKKLDQSWKDARLTARHFGSEILPPEEAGKGAGATSDLIQALRQISSGEGERPQSIVVLSDGRLTRPSDKATPEWDQVLRQAAGGIPVHSVILASELPRDRSILKIGFTGTAVAHQPITLQLEVGCYPEELCAEVEVVVRELLEGQEPTEIARGKTQGADGLAKLDLEVILERAGGRVIEIELVSEEADEVPENDRRVLPVQVRRDRLRILHVAGRPTYDVRALRMFLKSDESIDLISFFILRTLTDQVDANPDELALIPFPVDELFNEHLESFDAIILQDIDARLYGLSKYFPAIKGYVRDGGGLILVGGQTGFSAGGYAGSEVGAVLPVELPTTGDFVTRRPFVPVYTAAGRAAPLLGSLRTTMGDELPEMSGANILGEPFSGAVVLWEHPTLTQGGQSGADPMPILALGEVGDGRTIAISVDSTHQLRFGELGASTGGRAYADLWSGLLGWLMRDPRFEGAQIRLEGECVAGRDLFLRVEPPPPTETKVEVTLERLGSTVADTRALVRVESGADAAPRYIARGTQPGGYAGRVKIGDAPPTRSVFSCEVGGESWADSRPDAQRLRDISLATGGTAVTIGRLDELPKPASTFIAARRESAPLLPPWVWALAASLFMSLHWVLRRAVGYA